MASCKFTPEKYRAPMPTKGAIIRAPVLRVSAESDKKKTKNVKIQSIDDGNPIYDCIFTIFSECYPKFLAQRLAFKGMFGFPYGVTSVLI